MDSPADRTPGQDELLAFERRKALMRDFVFGLALEPSERPHPPRPEQ